MYRAAVTDDAAQNTLHIQVGEDREVLQVYCSHKLDTVVADVAGRREKERENCGGTLFVCMPKQLVLTGERWWGELRAESRGVLGCGSRLLACALRPH